MQNRFFAMALIVAGLTLADAAAAQSLRERQAMREAEEAFAETAASMNEQCETEISAEIVWDNFTSADFEANFSLSGYCGQPLDAIRALCEADDGGLGKAAVQQTVKRVTCSRAEERTLTVQEDGTVDYTVNFDSSNDYSYARDALLDQL